MYFPKRINGTAIITMDKLPFLIEDTTVSLALGRFASPAYIPTMIPAAIAIELGIRTRILEKVIPYILPVRILVPKEPIIVVHIN